MEHLLCLRLCARCSEPALHPVCGLCTTLRHSAPNKPTPPDGHAEQGCTDGNKGKEGRDKAGNLASSRTLGGNSSHRGKEDILWQPFTVIWDSEQNPRCEKSRNGQTDSSTFFMRSVIPAHQSNAGIGDILRAVIRAQSSHFTY